MSSESLLVFTCEYTGGGNDPNSALLRESCERVGIKLGSYGHGEPWPGFMGRIKGAAEYLRGRTEERVLFLDSSDTFVLDPASKLSAWFGTRILLGGATIIAGEKNCYPEPSLAPKFRYTRGPYKYPNGGCWGGWRKWVLEDLDLLVEGQTRDDDQYEWSILLPPRAVDNKCELFQTMYGFRDGDIDWNTFRNTLTGTYPSVFHFNGRAPGREETYRKALEVGRVKPLQP
jgi:hypothetical protein